MGRSKLFCILLALSLVVSLALAPCRADEIVAEDDAFDADNNDDTEVSTSAEPSGFLSSLFGGRRFLWSLQAHRMLHSCKQKCEDKNKKCNTDYSKCKRENRDDPKDHAKCTDKYKKCKRKAKKCRSKCD